MVAGVLRKLGVPMGTAISEANNEDQDFLAHQGRRDLFEDIACRGERMKYLSQVREIILRRNCEHDVWGWKDPIAPFYTNDLVGCLRNPIYIVVARDVGAVAQRAVIEEELSGEQLLAHVDVAVGVYQKCLDIVRRYKRPTLIVSYERALRSPRAFGRAVAEIIGIGEPPGFGEWLDGYVKADRRNGSIDLVPNTSPVTDVSATCAATETILLESMRLWKGGYHLRSVAHGNLETAASGLYVASVRAMSEDRHEDARTDAFKIVALFAEIIPQLADGPLGVLAHDAAGVGVTPPYPDLLCGALFIVGFSSLLLGSAQLAFLYLKIAQSKMAARIYDQPEHSVLCVGNYGSCLFHLALVAAIMQRADVYLFALGILEREALCKSSQITPDLAVWAVRARDELNYAAVHSL